MTLLVFDFQTHSQLLWAHRETRKSDLLFTRIHGIVSASGTLSPWESQSCPWDIQFMHGTLTSWDIQFMGLSVYGALTSWDIQFMGNSVHGTFSLWETQFMGHSV